MGLKMEIQRTDILVIGSGIAGLSFALKMASSHPDHQIMILSKEGMTVSNTWLAQGGIAAVMEENGDSREQHALDTLKASQHTSDPTVTRKITKQAPDFIRELCHWGVSLDGNENGTFNKAQEGAHAFPRILHHKDHTGTELVTKLSLALEKFSNVTFYPYHMALDLMTKPYPHKKPGVRFCQGAYVMNVNSGSAKAISAPVTYLGCGGAGQVFPHTTNARIATGDGTALALRAGLTLKKMAYFQFHPTVFYQPGRSTTFLISEAVRGAGATLRNENGEAFMLRYHPQGDLAPRNIVTQAEFEQLEERGNGVLYLDGTPIPEITWKTHFPTIYEKCSALGLNPVKDWIPVLPAAHYQCGGIPVDKNGQTALKGLHAGGECAYSGLHGKNRLASNSLLEGMALADWSARAIKRNFPETYFYQHDQLPVTTYQKPSKSWIKSQKKQIQEQIQTLIFCSSASCSFNTLYHEFDQLLKTWQAWQTKGYVLDKDFQELGSMIYTARAITKDKQHSCQLEGKSC
jgi:L-aspartate oxidase